MNDKKTSIFLILILSSLLSDNIKVNPIVFSHHSSNGSDWIYNNTPITIFGAGLEAYYDSKNWTIQAEYIQFGFLGELKGGLFDCHLNKVFHILINQKMLMDID
jgi:hypothetical protein